MASGVRASGFGPWQWPKASPMPLDIGRPERRSKVPETRKTRVPRNKVSLLGFLFASLDHIFWRSRFQTPVFNAARASSFLSRPALIPAASFCCRRRVKVIRQTGPQLEEGRAWQNPRVCRGGLAKGSEDIKKPLCQSPSSPEDARLVVAGRR